MHGCIKDLNLDKESELGNIILGHSYEISFVTDDDEILNADDAMLIVDDDKKILLYLCTFNKEFDSLEDEVVNNSLSEIDSEFENTFTKRCMKVINNDVTGFFEYLKIIHV